MWSLDRICLVQSGVCQFSSLPQSQVQLLLPIAFADDPCDEVTSQFVLNHPLWYAEFLATLFVPLPLYLDRVEEFVESLVPDRPRHDRSPLRATAPSYQVVNRWRHGG